ICKTRYRVMDFIGEGSFGKVAQCLDLNMGRRVALKIHKNNKHMVNESEVAILEKVRALDPDQNNIVKYIDNFRFNDISCLAFEMLDRSLWKLMEMDKFEPLSLAEIRSVTYQLLVAFEALKNIGIMHTDLKPDNIMLVNHRDHPFKVKLIDFGLALPVRKAKVGMTIQPAAYRALEVNLGLPLSESVDMWGVGCIMAFMYFGMNLFPSSCAYKWMKTITTGKHKSLPKKTSSKQDNAEERVAFFDLLKCCLHLNAEKRIRPREALSDCPPLYCMYLLAGTMTMVY
uniref:Protein kinase domain-containing protein n=1 Tax=Cynoglossus semilaevis TaxID=244447 RepID=A0A3P8W8H8_CYNSE